MKDGKKATLTKADIDAMAMEIADYVEHLYDPDMCGSIDVAIYYNNKRLSWSYKGPTVREIEEDVDPHTYFDWAAYNHILSMSFEGILYSMYNERGEAPGLDKIFKKYGCYAELGNSWNLTLYPLKDDMEVEYTNYSSEEQPTDDVQYLYYGMSTTDIEIMPLFLIMDLWYDLSKAIGDKGSCVLGAGFSFKYKDRKYFMMPCSPYQGSISWETHKDKVEGYLAKIGATDIQYHWGNMD